MMAVEYRSPKKFALEIEQMVKNNDLSYMDAILEFCLQRSIEPETIAKLVNKQLKDKLEVEATALHFLPNKAKLPI